MSEELSLEEETEIAEKESMRRLGISFKEFRKRWFRGDYKDDHRVDPTSVAFFIHGMTEAEHKAWEDNCE